MIVVQQEVLNGLQALAFGPSPLSFFLTFSSFQSFFFSSLISFIDSCDNLAVIFFSLQTINEFSFR